jgi:hypothetical protein
VWRHSTCEGAKLKAVKATKVVSSSRSTRGAPCSPLLTAMSARLTFNLHVKPEVLARDFQSGGSAKDVTSLPSSEANSSGCPFACDPRARREQTRVARAFYPPCALWSL